MSPFSSHCVRRGRCLFTSQRRGTQEVASGTYRMWGCLRSKFGRDWELGHFEVDLAPKLQCQHSRLHSMDSPMIARLFRQLFTHRPCQSRAGGRKLRRTQVRYVSGRGEGGDGARPNDHHWQQRTDLFPLDMSSEYQKYPIVTADQLRGRRERPRRVKMLMRDFIEGRSTTYLLAGQN